MPPRHTLISSVKDEGPFLLEWVAHHLVLGGEPPKPATSDGQNNDYRFERPVSFTHTGAISRGASTSIAGAVSS
ncbi:hypothetical protein [Cypionkella psychrotolerans]|uniref:hypothetical protein n=1 Tax=Cypionkella psychrotolerans TaxID=1678131 RepID=UPI000A7CF531|nr:hypothetical protein [Cypionkella psychrotolerans]